MTQQYEGVLGFLNTLPPGVSDMEPDPLNEEIPLAALPGPMAGDVMPAGPGESMAPGRFEETVDPQMQGSERATSWDQTFEMVPVYQLPDGSTYVGDLSMAPSLPQDLEPVEFRKVPTSGGGWKVS